MRDGGIKKLLEGLRKAEDVGGSSPGRERRVEEGGSVGRGLRRSRGLRRLSIG